MTTASSATTGSTSGVYPPRSEAVSPPSDSIPYLEDCIKQPLGLVEESRFEQRVTRPY